jgi:hypothetical protein
LGASDADTGSVLPDSMTGGYKPPPETHASGNILPDSMVTPESRPEAPTGGSWGTAQDKVPVLGASDADTGSGSSMRGRGALFSAHDMTPAEWTGLEKGLGEVAGNAGREFVKEEEREPEHETDKATFGSTTGDDGDDLAENGDESPDDGNMMIDDMPATDDERATNVPALGDGASNLLGFAGNAEPQTSGGSDNPAVQEANRVNRSPPTY